MMVAPLSEGRHPGLHLREFGICAVCSMSTSTTQEGKGEPCIGKDTNSTATNRSTKALQIVKHLEGTFNGNSSQSMGKGCDLYGPSRTTTRTYEGNFVGSAMDRTENRKSPASPVRVKTAANWIRKLKPNADRKSQKITNIIADPHALITAYEHIKSKLRNMTPRGDDERKTFLGGGGEGNPFFLGINRRWFEHTAKRLRTRKYPFKPARQVNIPKPGKPKETRLLAMIGLKDHQVI